MGRAVLTTRRLAALGLREDLYKLRSRILQRPIDTDLLSSAAGRTYLQQRKQDAIKAKMIEQLDKIIAKIDGGLP